MTVSLRDVTIRYGDLCAVANATADFPPGAVGLLGRNGAGKSSILRALLGLVRPSAGELRILDLQPHSSSGEIRRRVGYMPERDCYITGLNGFETVRLAAELTGLPGLDAAQRAHEVLYLVGLDEQRYRPVAEYTAGMRQRVKLAAALVHDPELLFLDEPTNGMDPAGRRDMLQLIGMLASDLGKSVVLSSHILTDVEAICDDIVLLERGRVLASGPLRDLTRGADRTFTLETTAAAEGLRSRLAARGVTEVDVAREGCFELRLPEGLATAVIFAAVQEAGAAVRELVERRRTLEEVFLGAVRSAGEVAP